MTGLPPATAVTSGERHSCALLKDGSSRCWGDNFFGELGNGTVVSSATPAPVQW
jgi:hypothetical protein